VAPKASRELADTVLCTSGSCVSGDLLYLRCLRWQHFPVIYLMPYLFSSRHPHLNSEKRESYIVHYRVFIIEACWYLSVFLMLKWKVETAIFASSKKHHPPQKNPT